MPRVTFGVADETSTGPPPGSILEEPFPGASFAKGQRDSQAPEPGYLPASLTPLHSRALTLSLSSAPCRRALLRLWSVACGEAERSRSDARKSQRETRLREEKAAREKGRAERKAGKEARRAEKAEKKALREARREARGSEDGSERGSDEDYSEEEESEEEESEEEEEEEVEDNDGEAWVDPDDVDLTDRDALLAYVLGEEEYKAFSSRVAAALIPSESLPSGWSHASLVEQDVLRDSRHTCGIDYEVAEANDGHNKSNDDGGESDGGESNDGADGSAIVRGVTYPDMCAAMADHAAVWCERATALCVSTFLGDLLNRITVRHVTDVRGHVRVQRPAERLAHLESIARAIEAAASDSDSDSGGGGGGGGRGRRGGKNAGASKKSGSSKTKGSSGGGTRKRGSGRRHSGDHSDDPDGENASGDEEGDPAQAMADPRAVLEQQCAVEDAAIDERLLGELEAVAGDVWRVAVNTAGDADPDALGDDDGEGGDPLEEVGFGRADGVVAADDIEFPAALHSDDEENIRATTGLLPGFEDEAAQEERAGGDDEDGEASDASDEANGRRGKKGKASSSSKRSAKKKKHRRGGRRGSTDSDESATDGSSASDDSDAGDADRSGSDPDAPELPRHEFVIEYRLADMADIVCPPIPPHPSSPEAAAASAAASALENGGGNSGNVNNAGGDSDESDGGDVGGNRKGSKSKSSSKKSKKSSRKSGGHGRSSRRRAESESESDGSDDDSDAGREPTPELDEEELALIARQRRLAAAVASARSLWGMSRIWHNMCELGYNGPVPVRYLHLDRAETERRAVAHAEAAEAPVHAEDAEALESLITALEATASAPFAVPEGWTPKTHEPPRLWVTGPPLSGKTTLSRRIAHRLGLVHVEPGALLMAAITAGTRLGKSADTYLRRGAAVPPSIVASCVRQALASEECAYRGYVLDGWPCDAHSAVTAFFDPERTGGDPICPLPGYLVTLSLETPEVLMRGAGCRMDPVTGHLFSRDQLVPPRPREPSHHESAWDPRGWRRRTRAARTAAIEVDTLLSRLWRGHLDGEVSAAGFAEDPVHGPDGYVHPLEDPDLEPPFPEGDDGDDGDDGYDGKDPDAANGGIGNGDHGAARRRWLAAARRAHAHATGSLPRGVGSGYQSDEENRVGGINDDVDDGGDDDGDDEDDVPSDDEAARYRAEFGFGLGDLPRAAQQSRAAAGIDDDEEDGEDEWEPLGLDNDGNPLDPDDPGVRRRPNPFRRAPDPRSLRRDNLLWRPEDADVTIATEAMDTYAERQVSLAGIEDAFRPERRVTIDARLYPSEIAAVVERAWPHLARAPGVHTVDVSGFDEEDTEAMAEALATSDEGLPASMSVELTGPREPGPAYPLCPVELTLNPATPLPGHPRFNAIVRGRYYAFSTRHHRDAFLANPLPYLATVLGGGNNSNKMIGGAGDGTAAGTGDDTNAAADGGGGGAASDPSSRMRIVVSGPPLSGASSVAAALCASYGLRHLHAGRLARRLLRDALDADEFAALGLADDDPGADYSFEGFGEPGIAGPGLSAGRSKAEQEAHRSGGGDASARSAGASSSSANSARDSRIRNALRDGRPLPAEVYVEAIVRAVEDPRDRLADITEVLEQRSRRRRRREGGGNGSGSDDDDLADEYDEDDDDAAGGGGDGGGDGDRGQGHAAGPLVTLLSPGAGFVLEGLPPDPTILSALLDLGVLPTAHIRLHLPAGDSSVDVSEEDLSAELARRALRLGVHAATGEIVRVSSSLGAEECVADPVVARALSASGLTASGRRLVARCEDSGSSGANTTTNSVNLLYVPAPRPAGGSGGGSSADGRDGSDAEGSDARSLSSSARRGRSGIAGGGGNGGEGGTVHIGGEPCVPATSLLRYPVEAGAEAFAAQVEAVTEIMAAHDVPEHAVDCTARLDDVIAMARAAVDPFFPRGTPADDLPGGVAGPGDPEGLGPVDRAQALQRVGFGTGNSAEPDEDAGAGGDEDDPHATVVFGRTGRFCPVALADDGVLVPGKEECAVRFRGEWYFTRGADEARRFAVNPVRYATRSGYIDSGAAAASIGISISTINNNNDVGRDDRDDDDGGGGPRVPPPRIVLTGPPSSGKSTQARLISERFGVPVLDAAQAIEDYVLDNASSRDAVVAARVRAIGKRRSRGPARDYETEPRGLVSNGGGIVGSAANGGLRDPVAGGGLEVDGGDDDDDDDAVEDPAARDEALAAVLRLALSREPYARGGWVLDVDPRDLTPGALTALSAPRCVDPSIYFGTGPNGHTNPRMSGGAVAEDAGVTQAVFGNDASLCVSGRPDAIVRLELPEQAALKRRHRRRTAADWEREKERRRRKEAIEMGLDPDAPDGDGDGDGDGGDAGSDAGSDAPVLTEEQVRQLALERIAAERERAAEAKAELLEYEQECRSKVVDSNERGNELATGLVEHAESLEIACYTVAAGTTARAVAARTGLALSRYLGPRRGSLFACAVPLTRPAARALLASGFADLSVLGHACPVRFGRWRSQRGLSGDSGGNGSFDPLCGVHAGPTGYAVLCRGRVYFASTRRARRAFAEDPVKYTTTRLARDDPFASAGAAPLGSEASGPLRPLLPRDVPPRLAARLAVVGPPGSGKSTLALALSTSLRVPIVTAARSVARVTGDALSPALESSGAILGRLDDADNDDDSGDSGIDYLAYGSLSLRDPRLPSTDLGRRVLLGRLRRGGALDASDTAECLALHLASLPGYVMDGFPVLPAEVDACEDWGIVPDAVAILEQQQNRTAGIKTGAAAGGASNMSVPYGGLDPLGFEGDYKNAPPSESAFVARWSKWCAAVGPLARWGWASSTDAAVLSHGAACGDPSALADRYEAGEPAVSAHVLEVRRSGVVIPSGSSCWKAHALALSAALDRTQRRRAMAQRLANDEAAWAWKVGVTPGEAEAAIGHFGRYCPVSLRGAVAGLHFTAPGPRDMEHAAVFRGRFYFMRGHDELGAFLRDPEAYISGALPDALPRRLDEAEAATVVASAIEAARESEQAEARAAEAGKTALRNPSSADLPGPPVPPLDLSATTSANGGGGPRIRLQGYCPVTLGDPKLSGYDSVVLGDPVKYAVEYDGGVFAMRGESQVAEFMRAPWLYDRLTLAFKVPAKPEDPMLDSLPIHGYLEQRVGRILTRGLTLVAKTRPCFPYRKPKESALKHLALFLRANNPSIDNPLIKERCEKKLRDYEHLCGLIAFVRKHSPLLHPNVQMTDAQLQAYERRAEMLDRVKDLDMQSFIE